MNPFEYIKEMKDAIIAEMKNKDLVENEGLFTAAEHYNRMLNMLSILEEEMKGAEYNYEVESINHSIKTFDEFTVLQKQLSDDVIIFQPVASNNDEITCVDMQSLADILRQVHDNGQIKENIILLPPNVNTFRAKLASSSSDNNNEDEE